MRVAYYVSDYGYGHAARSVAVIRKLVRMKPECEVIVCQSFAADFMEASLELPQVRIRRVKTDLGFFLKEGSVEPDVSRLQGAYQDYVKSWPEHVAREKVFLREEAVDLVLTDVDPLCAVAASECGIPSVGISNFTWATAYEGQLTEEELEPLRACYEQLTAWIQLPGGEEALTYPKKRTVGWFARAVDDVRVQEIRRSILNGRHKRIVFVGIGMKIGAIDWSHYAIWQDPDVVLLVSHHSPWQGENVVRIPADETESQHYIAAADLVLTKPGWGTVSEALTSGTPLLLLEREGMQEDLNTIAVLKDMGLYHGVTMRKLSELEKWPEIGRMKPVENDAGQVVKAVFDVMGE